VFNCIFRASACFNPCFPGSSAESVITDELPAAFLGFNPCFPGSSAESRNGPGHRRTRSIVSILVFLDQALKEPVGPVPGEEALVSILVFLDQALKAGVDGIQNAGLDLFQSLFSWIKR